MKVAEEEPDSAMVKDFHIVLDEFDEQKVLWAFPFTDTPRPRRTESLI